MLTNMTGGSHQTCGILWADNYQVMSQSKDHLDQMTRELTEEAGRWELKPQPASPWWSSTKTGEFGGRHDGDESRQSEKSKVKRNPTDGKDDDCARH